MALRLRVLDELTAGARSWREADASLASRGVSRSWLIDFVSRVQSELNGDVPPPRDFTDANAHDAEKPSAPYRLLNTHALVEHVIKPFTAELKAPLYAFVPEAHRGPPETFTSHTWSSLLIGPQRQRIGTLDALRAKAGEQEEFLWVDFACYNQHLFESIAADMAHLVSEIGALSVVATPMPLFTRSWCLWELLAAYRAGAGVDVRVESGWRNDKILSVNSLYRSFAGLAHARSTSQLDQTDIYNGFIATFGAEERANESVRTLIEEKFADPIFELQDSKETLAFSAQPFAWGGETHTAAGGAPFFLRGLLDCQIYGENLFGDDGDDVLLGRAGIDTLNGGIGADSLYGGDGDDDLDGGADNDLLDGGNNNDTLDGGDGVDVLYGRAGVDSLDGGAGADQMYGGGGNDTYYVDDAGDVVGESAGSGTDTVVSSVTRGLGAYIENLVLSGVAAINGTGNILANIMTGNSAANVLSGQAGFDTLNGEAGNDTLNGGDGNDTLNGGGDDDVLDGGNDADTLNGGDGADTLYGRTQNDTLNGDGGNDTIFGGDGDDVATGGDGDDLIDGLNNNDTLSGGDGADDLYGRQNNDTLNGDAGNDDLYGGDGDDQLNGGADDDLLDGGNGIDVLNGGDGADTLYGRNGVDTLDGGLGADMLLGGNDADTFVFSTALGGGNIDTIQFYSAAEDTIQLDVDVFSAIGLGTLAANAFVIGSAATTADHRIIYDATTGALYYDADGDGAGAAVQFATLGTGLALTNADFVGGP